MEPGPQPGPNPSLEALPARPDEFVPFSLGSWRVWPPVVLAPMCGVTDYPFRALCRRFGAPLCVSEMIAARALLQGNEATRRLATFGPDESPRSLQLHGSDAASVGEAVRRLVGEGAVDHIDLNFGCPARKVTSKGAGAALLARPACLAAIVRAAVQAAAGTPVSVKLRLGLDEDSLTYLEAARAAEAEGCALVTLHARTAAQLYHQQARWDAIAELKTLLRVPLIGNGDIWSAGDALRMMRRTGCDGVMVGRGCLGRPWLFRDLERMFYGLLPEPAPQLGMVVDVMVEHLRALERWSGERAALLLFRRHACWYTKGFRGSAAWRQAFMVCRSIAELESLLLRLDRNEALPRAAERMPRGKRSGTRQVLLPEPEQE